MRMFYHGWHQVLGTSGNDSKEMSQKLVRWILGKVGQLVHCLRVYLPDICSAGAEPEGMSLCKHLFSFVPTLWLNCVV